MLEQGRVIIDESIMVMEEITREHSVSVTPRFLTVQRKKHRNLQGNNKR